MFKKGGKFKKDKPHKNPFKDQEWGQVKFVPKVPKRSQPQRESSNPATPWKKFKDDLLEKQREDNSIQVDMNSSEAKDILKKREQNYKRMLITEQSKDKATKWESFDDEETPQSTSSNLKKNKFAETIMKDIDLENFDSKKLNFKQNNNFRKMLTKSIVSKSNNLKASVRDMKRIKDIKKKMKNKNEKQ